MERWREWTVWSSGRGHRAKFSQYESAVTPPAPAERIGVTRSFSWRKSLFTPAWVRGASAQRAPPLPSQRASVGILNPAALRGPPPRSGSPKPQKRTLLESPTDTSERGLENHITCIQRGGLALPRAVVSHQQQLLARRTLLPVLSLLAARNRDLGLQHQRGTSEGPDSAYFFMCIFLVLLLVLFGFHWIRGCEHKATPLNSTV